MTTWIIEPRDPLIVRDGRPFGPMPGARAASLTFPFPSTTTGGVRTRDGLDADGRFQESELPRVKKIGVCGPLLVELDSTTGEIAKWLAPVPADALLLDIEPPDLAKVIRRRLVPLELPPQTSTNLPNGMSLVGMPKTESPQALRESTSLLELEPVRAVVAEPARWESDARGPGTRWPRA